MHLHKMCTSLDNYKSRMSRTPIVKEDYIGRINEEPTLSRMLQNACQHRTQTFDYQDLNEVRSERPI